MKKNKKVLTGIAAAAVLIIAGVIAGGYFLTGGGRKTFPADGYILEVASEEDVQRVMEITFSAGTIYKEKFPSSYIFKDIQGKKNTVGEKNFIHYRDGSLSALSKGVAVNVQEIGDGFLEFFGLGQGMVMTKAPVGWEIDNNGNIMEFPELLWQLSENKLLTASDEMTLEVRGRLPEKISGYLEVTWVDRGIVQVAHQNDIIQVVAMDGKVTYKNGATLDFARGAVFGADGRVGFTLEDLYADTDNSIAVRSMSAISWTPPVYHIETQDGEDGEAGMAGENGDIGEAGENGEKGEDGENGEGGEGGTVGSDGRAGAEGAQGAAGRKGSEDEEYESEPGLGSIKLSELNYDYSSITKLTLSVDDTNGMLTKLSNTGTIKIRDAKTKVLVASAPFEIDGGSDAVECDVSAFQGVLKADREYTLYILKDYMISEGSDASGLANTGIKTFIKRDFFTDSNGVTADVEKLEEDGLYLKLFDLTAGSNNSWKPTKYMLLIRSGDGWVTYPASLSNSIAPETLRYNEEIHIPVAELLKEKYGEVVGTSNIPFIMEFYVGDTGTWSLDGSGVPTGVSNGSVSKSSRILSGSTLKKRPEIGDVNATLGNGCYELSVSVKSDPDKSIESYRFSVIQNDRAIKVLESDNNSAKWYYDAAADNGMPYEVTCEIVYFDNEKENVVKAAGANEIYVRNTRVGAEVSYLPYVQIDGIWRNPETGKAVTDVDNDSRARIWGVVKLDLKESTAVLKDKEIRIELKKVTSSSFAVQDNTKIYIWYIPYEEQKNQKFYIPIKCLEVESGASYTLSVYGQIRSSQDGDAQEVCLGTTVIERVN